MLFLAAGHAGLAGVPADFSLFADGTSIVWSKMPLNKGDIVEVHAFNAEPGTLVLLALCNDKCDDAHVVKNIPVYRAQINMVTEKYTLEESGHLAFWTVRPPRLELNAGASKAISEDSRNPVAGVIHSGFSGLYSDAEVLRIIKSELGADQAKVRFDGGRYVTVKRISAESQSNPPGERQ
jgi:hypothetical protein